MLLSDIEIRRHLELGSIVIAPFNDSQLQNVSYDLTLGRHFWRYVNHADVVRPHEADLEYVHEDASEAGGILLAPGERVLGHSVEFAGGTVGHRRPRNPAEAALGVQRGSDTVVPIAVTSHLQATSTAARIGLTACMCAGWGDVGFINRWTFEIENRRKDSVFLPVGAIIAQLVFEEVTPPSRIYSALGNYQSAEHLDKLEEVWSPDAMRPKRLKVVAHD